MVITKDKVVSLSYELKVNGELVDKAEANNPLEFLYGRGALIARFEENINNLGIGDSFEFMIPSNEGYGDVNQEAIIDLPKDIFKVDGEIEENLLEVGKYLPMLDQEGNQLNGKILEIKEEAVVMDFNHPLAGQDLHFTGKVESIREATDEELSHGHVHSHGHHHKHDENGGCCGEC
ncbi:MAG TPA: FKBP-type peptidyl-prolyl cis-trans isomerase [Tenuifilaceae bacterium]|nr:FKBP-type peptidyl-prolyl cis-trans isomerase [Tenuifilaceae bacterium]HPE17197.1 FKBP-type peptidyl-prolyl cis-trans isomerase [Tenuifilaceae bacterium]HPJ44755.1 FKBP-type peptidyl-prolyl cis-trans isomerase [Tenuifilaceae bacterium]HPQ33309.1 FKBP-type peptidyl-prolyl cis-trans isomerase [Tenuifilaceae bacterium]HRX67596.1 FKBP-type peptidyl-prolyl cis-trans isomerase [Tenuifilaceae bacterium]